MHLMGHMRKYCLCWEEYVTHCKHAERILIPKSGVKVFWLMPSSG